MYPRTLYVKEVVASPLPSCPSNSTGVSLGLQPTRRSARWMSFWRMPRERSQAAMWATRFSELRSDLSN